LLNAGDNLRVGMQFELIKTGNACMNAGHAENVGLIHFTKEHGKNQWGVQRLSFSFLSAQLAGRFEMTIFQ
jgi:hypothetical protein